MVMMFVEVERGGGEFVSSRVKSKSWYVSTVGIKFYGGHRYSEERYSVMMDQSSYMLCRVSVGL